MSRFLTLSVAVLALSGCAYFHHDKMAHKTAAPAAPSSAAPLAPVVDTAADVAVLKGLTDQFAVEFNAHNVDAFMAHYADDVFVFDAVPPRQYVGVAAYRADFEGILKAVKDVKVEISDFAAFSDGQMAWAHSIQHYTGKMGKHKFDLTVRESDVYTKINGAWKIVHEHASVPVDIEHGNKADLKSKP